MLAPCSSVEMWSSCHLYEMLQQPKHIYKEILALVEGDVGTEHARCPEPMPESPQCSFKLLLKAQTWVDLGGFSCKWKGCSPGVGLGVSFRIERLGGNVFFHPFCENAEGV